MNREEKTNEVNPVIAQCSTLYFARLVVISGNVRVCVIVYQICVTHRYVGVCAYMIVNSNVLWVCVDSCGRIQ